MEGADTWYYDQQFTATPVHPMFNISGLEDGSGDLTVEEGQPGSCAEGMSYTFSGDNSYIDHIAPVDPAVMMFMNSNPQYGTGVSYDAGTYKTVGFSFEFGGLQDGERSKDELMIEILDFFEIQGLWTTVQENNPHSSIVAKSYPNPYRDETVIRFETTRESTSCVEVYNVSGQLVKQLANGQFLPGIHEIRWDGTSSDGHPVSSGLYLYRIQSGDDVTTGRMMKIE